MPDSSAIVPADVEASVVSVHSSVEHSFGKPARDEITLIAGLGVDGDAHSGTQVKHRSRVRADPTQPNLRQVHLAMAELLDELAAAGHTVQPGQLGENITTRGVDLIGLPAGSTLRLGQHAVVALTGLRNPCGQINDLGAGVLQQMFVDGTPYGQPGEQVGRTGVMGVVVVGGTVRAGDPLLISYPAGIAAPLQRV